MELTEIQNPPPDMKSSWAVWIQTHFRQLFSALRQLLIGIYVDEDGKVGIGTTSPSEKLEVTGKIKITVTSNQSQSLWFNNTDINGDWYVDAYGGRFRIHEWQPNNVERLTILTGGNVGIGVIDPHSKLEVAGAISSATSTFSTVGPTDDLDVSGINTLFIDNSGNAVTIGGFAGGVDGQILHIVLINAGANDVTLEHNEAGATQKIFLHVGAVDETLNTEYGGWILVCHAGIDWHDCSHARHV